LHPQRKLADGHRAEAVAQVVEAQRTEARRLLRRLVSDDERVVVQDLAGWPGEHQVVVVGEELAPAELGQLERDLWHEWDRADTVALGEVLAAFVGEASLHVDERIGDVD
jgi:hypothetical protein